MKFSGRGWCFWSTPHVQLSGILLLGTGRKSRSGLGMDYQEFSGTINLFRVTTEVPSPSTFPFVLSRPLALPLTTLGVFGTGRHICLPIQAQPDPRKPNGIVWKTRCNGLSSFDSAKPIIRHYSLITPRSGGKIGGNANENDDKLRREKTYLSSNALISGESTCFIRRRKNGLHLERERLLFPRTDRSPVDLYPGIIDRGQRASACVKAMWYFVPLSRWFVVLHPARRLAEQAVGVDYLSLRGANRSRITSIHDVRRVFTFALRSELMPDGFFGSCANMYTRLKKSSTTWL